MPSVLSCLVMLFGMFFSVQSALAGTGIALVHGKGPPRLANPADAWGYWGDDMIQSITRNGQVPFVVAHYDGTLSIFRAAHVLASQLDDFTRAHQINDLIIHAHSYGNVVLRFIFSNPGLDPKFARIVKATRWVNSLGGPHLGSEAATVAIALSEFPLTSWLMQMLSYDSDSTKNLRPTEMAYYNEYWLHGTQNRPMLPKRFFMISANGLWNDFFTNFHPEDLGLAVVSSVVGYPDTDDGLVPRYSAEGLTSEKVWFRTDTNHYHLTNNAYRNIGDILATDLDP